MHNSNNHNDDNPSNSKSPTSNPLSNFLTSAAASLALTVTLSTSALVTTALPTPAYAATDPGAIVGCLVKKCPAPLARCIANPKCLPTP